LVDSKFVRAQIGRIPVEYLETLLRQCFSQYTKAFFHGVHAPKIEVPFVPGKSPINYAGRVYDEKEMQSAVEASLDFWLTEGRFAEEFQYELAEKVGVEYALLVNSGSSANLLALTALTSPLLGEKRLKTGDEVITVAAGFPTTLNPIILNGLVPVFVDVDIPTYNAKVEEIEAAIGPKTKALFIAHTLGNPFDIGNVLALCQKHNLWLIEDCCDALGSTYNSKPKTQNSKPKIQNCNTLVLSECYRLSASTPPIISQQARVGRCSHPTKPFFASFVHSKTGGATVIAVREKAIPAGTDFPHNTEIYLTAMTTSMSIRI